MVSNISGIRSMIHVDLADRRVMIREDFNVPIKDGHVVNGERIRRALPTIQEALNQNAAVILLSHLGRPQEGRYDETYSLEPVAQWLCNALGQDVQLKRDWIEGVDVSPGQVVLCENVRFNMGEQANDPELSKKMAALCDVFVMDAFATAHRAQASTVGIIQHARCACAGLLLEKELRALSQVLDHPRLPVVAILGGAKLSTKLPLLDRFLDWVSVLIPGGGIANTFLAASGFAVGRSLYEATQLEAAKRLLLKAEQRGVRLPLPQDVLVSDHCSDTARAVLRPASAVADHEMILDIGEKTAAYYAQLIQTAATVVWNGPVGCFECSAFAEGTRAISHAVANSSAFSVVGGGDTIAAIEQSQVQDQMSYVCTGGGAFLAYLQGEPLPALLALAQRDQSYA